MPLLQVRHYTKHFHIHSLNREIPVFENLSFDLKQGQFMIVRGPNGIGKSTLLRCLFRSYLPTSGEALYESKYGTIDLARAADIDILTLRSEEIGFVTQFLRPRPRVTALDLVAEPLIDNGVSRVEALTQAEDMLDNFGLKHDLWDAYPTTFSGGEQQKVNLARALVAPRRLLLLDEPTASLDVDTRLSLSRRLGELKAQGVAMIGVFHHPQDVEEHIDDEVYLSVIHSTANGAVQELVD